MRQHADCPMPDGARRGNFVTYPGGVVVCLACDDLACGACYGGPCRCGHPDADTPMQTCGSCGHRGPVAVDCQRWACVACGVIQARRDDGGPR